MDPRRPIIPPAAPAPASLHLSQNGTGHDPGHDPHLLSPSNYTHAYRGPGAELPYYTRAGTAAPTPAGPFTQDIMARPVSGATQNGQPSQAFVHHDHAASAPGGGPAFVNGFGNSLRRQHTPFMENGLVVGPDPAAVDPQYANGVPAPFPGHSLHHVTHRSGQNQTHNQYYYQSPDRVQGQVQSQAFGSTHFPLVSPTHPSFASQISQHPGPHPGNHTGAIPGAIPGALPVPGPISGQIPSSVPYQRLGLVSGLLPGLFSGLLPGLISGISLSQFQFPSRTSSVNSQLFSGIISNHFQNSAPATTTLAAPPLAPVSPEKLGLYGLHEPHVYKTDDNAASGAHADLGGPEQDFAPNTESHDDHTPASASSHSASASASAMAEESTHKPPRGDSPEGHLLALATELTGWKLAESVPKIKIMDTNAAELQHDPIFGQICNPKDVKQEKHHQVFALAWLNNSCEVSPASVVPRSRVYARYVQTCGDYSLTPLMPAAFGRLIRVIFPNFTTRRLGMRGKLKYHYCGIKLKGDQQGASLNASAVTESPPTGDNSPSSVPVNVNGTQQVLSQQVPSQQVPSQQIPSQQIPSQQVPFQQVPSQQVPSQQVPSQHISSQLAPQLAPQQPAFQTPACPANVQDHFLVNDFKYMPGLHGIIEESVAEYEQNALQFPSITPYFPPGCDYDPDVADTLSALVKIQYTTIFDLIRYLKKDEFFRALHPVSSLMSGPMYKLLNSEHLIAWMKDCDLIFYRAILKMLSRLQVSTVSKDVVGTLREISQEYVGIMVEALDDKFSREFAALKLKMARQFVKLVGRLVRCIEAGFKAAIVLSNASDRETMLQDWTNLNFHDTVLREIPCNVETARKIVDVLETLVGQLLQQTPPEGAPLVNFASFLFELPGLFPNVNPWLFSLLLSNLLTSFIREMSMVGSRSFKLWWIVGCWVDEYISWSFELGGFLHDESNAPKESEASNVGLSEAEAVTEAMNADWGSFGDSVATVDLLDSTFGHF